MRLNAWYWNGYQPCTVDYLGRAPCKPLAAVVISLEVSKRGDGLALSPLSKMRGNR